MQRPQHVILFCRRQKRVWSSLLSLQSFTCSWWGSCMTHRLTKISRLMTGKACLILSFFFSFFFRLPCIFCWVYLSIASQEKKKPSSKWIISGLTMCRWLMPGCNFRASAPYYHRSKGAAYFQRSVNREKSTAWPHLRPAMAGMDSAQIFSCQSHL